MPSKGLSGEHKKERIQNSLIYDPENAGSLPSETETVCGNLAAGKPSFGYGFDSHTQNCSSSGAAGEPGDLDLRRDAVHEDTVGPVWGNRIWTHLCSSYGCRWFPAGETIGTENIGVRRKIQRGKTSRC